MLQATCYLYMLSGAIKAVETWPDFGMATGYSSGAVRMVSLARPPVHGRMSYHFISVDVPSACSIYTTTMSKYQAEWLEREFEGYGLHTPDPQWPGGAKVCVSFVVQYNMGAVSSG